MTVARSLSCWLIGGDSLLAECGDILLRGGHEVRGVITGAERVATWARAHALTCLDVSADYGAELALRPFDHLFAITHLALLPERILRLPTRGALNFHDGPLPQYAGLNAPAWALVNGEARHGVTWHMLTAELDGGPIVAQRSFALAPDETSFSLNARCFAAAIESFAELVVQLAAGTQRALPQDGSRRRVHARHRRPRATCALDWTRPARESEALVRALDFGRYPNPLGSAKCQRGERALLVTRARALAGEVHAAPGTVLDLDARGVRVATGDGVLSLSGFAELDGRELEPAQAARRLALAAGVVLEPCTGERAERLSALDPSLSRAERAWVRHLATLEPVALPLAPPAPDAAPRSALALDLVVPAELAACFPGHPLAQLLTAAFCAYLARLARRGAFDLGHADAALRAQAQDAPWIEARVPLRIEVDLDQDLRPLLQRVAAQCDTARARGPWLRDVIARQPELHALRGRAEPLFPIAVELCTAFGEPARTHGADWILEVCADGACRFVFERERVSPTHAASLHAGFEALLASLLARPELALAAHAMTSPTERERQRAWNRTERPWRREVCVPELFAEQVARTPDAIALSCAGSTLTYAELDARAERLADELSRRGVGPGQLVGIFLERSLELVIAVLGTLKAGGAYVPLDPEHPRERLALLLADARLHVIVTCERLASALPPDGARLLRLDVELPTGSARRRVATQPADLAYVIYTSGSTGQPKGVLVEHRNVASFFAAMDERVAHAPPGVWLALTQLSFDIAVLELLWPLCRGFEVVLYAGDERARPPAARRALDFSLFYFSSDEGQRGDGYRLLLEGARFADTHGFAAVWTPERHFHAFGGLFPNPAVTGAALATITSRVQIRAGSVVLPLHHPIRVAEDWALVDNLSGGRVALSFASGWNPDDFVLAPHNHARAKVVMLRDIEIVRRLWRGETLPFPGPDGGAVDVRTLPRPVQPELPVWLTAAGNLETYVAAGRMGANVLTHLLGQTPEQLAPKIRAYREARARAGFDPATGVVALMLHTFVGADEERVRESVRLPLERYLASSLDLLKQHAWSFPAFRRPGGGTEEPVDLDALGVEERAALVAHARERYYESSGLFGTPERCLAQLARLRAIDVDEIACLIDFGLPAEEVLASLPLLDEVRRRAQAVPAAENEPDGSSLAALILEKRVTHLQCTPSRARMLCAEPAVRHALRRVKHVFVGGEALPAELAGELALAVGGSLSNMYGPTETTIWSATHLVEAGASGIAPGTVSIGRPIANTRCHVLDERLQPLPLGVAGELFIAGDGVTRGYLRRPELDAERFLPEPAELGIAGARMYRTGDLVRYRDDGALEFLGRLDHQIKLRGRRLEPGEIEAELARDDVSERRLAEAVVVAREDTPGDQRLVAYLVPRGPAPDPARLRERLALRLPEYMIPAQFVFLPRLPRNSNGKIDRRALPAPEARAPVETVLPVGELETLLAGLWCETLGVARVGVEDNFFDLGGHSLLIVRLHRRLCELRTEPVPLTDLFRFPTVRSLARHLSADGVPPGLELEAASARGRRRRRAAAPLRPEVVEG